jgi:hypothetical protein
MRSGSAGKKRSCDPVSADTLLIVVSLAAALAAGCRAGQRAECDLLVDTANQRLEAISKHDPSQASDAEQAARTLDELARRYDELGQSVGALTLSTPELAKRARAYQKVAASAAASTRVLAGAVRQHDLVAQRAAEEDLARVIKEQQALVAEVNALCGR